MVTTHLFGGLLLPRIIARWLLFYNTTQLDAYKFDVPFISLILFLKQLRFQLANKAEKPRLVINSRNPTQVTHFKQAIGHVLSKLLWNYYHYSNCKRLLFVSSNQPMLSHILNANETRLTSKWYLFSERICFSSLSSFLLGQTPVLLSGKKHQRTNSRRLLFSINSLFTC